MKKHSKISI